jgi:hypothetical protein
MANDPFTHFAGTKHFRLPSRQNVVLFDDFVGDTFDTNIWAGAADAGATTPAITAAAGGAVRLVTGASDDEISEFAGEIIWNAAAGGLYFETRIKASAVTTLALAVGLTDAKQETNLLPASLSTTTFTTTASDAALWLYDTDATTDVWRGIGVKADTDITTKPTGAAPGAATYETLGIGVSSDGTAYWYQNGNLVGSSANAVTAATLLCPYVGAANRTAGASRNVDVDYVLVAQAR